MHLREGEKPVVDPAARLERDRETWNLRARLFSHLFYDLFYKAGRGGGHHSPLVPLPGLPLKNLWPIQLCLTSLNILFVIIAIFRFTWCEDGESSSGLQSGADVTWFITISGQLPWKQRLFNIVDAINMQFPVFTSGWHPLCQEISRCRTMGKI